MSKSGEPPPEVERLEQLRLFQATLWPAFEKERAKLREHDAEAQRLMNTDPKGHIESSTRRSLWRWRRAGPVANRNPAS